MSELAGWSEELWASASTGFQPRTRAKAYEEQARRAKPPQPAEELDAPAQRTKAARAEREAEEKVGRRAKALEAGRKRLETTTKEVDELQADVAWLERQHADANKESLRCTALDAQVSLAEQGTYRANLFGIGGLLQEEGLEENEDLQGPLETLRTRAEAAKVVAEEAAATAAPAAEAEEEAKEEEGEEEDDAEIQEE